MKKSYTRISMAALAVLAASVSVTGCGSSKSSADKDNELYVYNWGEYIDESVFPSLRKKPVLRSSTICSRPMRRCTRSSRLALFPTMLSALPIT